MTPAVRAAEKAGISFRVLRYAAGAGEAPTGEEAAARLGIAPERVFKTLLVLLDDGRPALAVLPVAARLDPKALAATLGARRAALAPPGRAERITGYVRGGMSPLGLRRPLPTAIDAAAFEAPLVYVSGGRRGLELELAPDDLARLCGARRAPIAR